MTLITDLNSARQWEIIYLHRDNVYWGIVHDTTLYFLKTLWEVHEDTEMWNLMGIYWIKLDKDHDGKKPDISYMKQSEMIPEYFDYNSCSIWEKKIIDALSDKWHWDSWFEIMKIWEDVKKAIDLELKIKGYL